MSDEWVLVYGPEEIPDGHTMHPHHVKAMEEGYKRANNPQKLSITNDMLTEVSLLPAQIAMMPYNYFNYILTGNKPNG